MSRQFYQVQWYIPYEGVEIKEYDRLEDAKKEAEDIVSRYKDDYVEIYKVERIEYKATELMKDRT